MKVMGEARNFISEGARGCGFKVTGRNALKREPQNTAL
jgi:hypothetical protein